ncbi:MAG: hypothetical protein U1E40_16820, partial [Amaricoccus sp.]
DMDPGALTDAEALVAAASPERPLSTRAARREAQRRAMAERIAAAGPPPEPGAGGIAGALFVPAAGALLAPGTPLLTQAQPLISAAPGGLFGDQPARGDAAAANGLVTTTP